MRRLLRSAPGPLVGVLVFALIAVLLTSMVAGTLSRGANAGSMTLHAEFRDVAGLRVGDDVRVAGVRVGRVDALELAGRHARVTLRVESAQGLDEATEASVAFLNLMGQRYIALSSGADREGAAALAEGDTIPLERTRPALDLTALFNAFRPLFDALRPEEINEFAGNLVAVLQGEGPTLRSLVQQTATLTTTVTDRDEVIGAVLDNVTAVLETADTHGDEIRALVGELGTLTAGLAEDRDELGATMDRVQEATTATSGLVADTATTLTRDIALLRRWSGFLAGQTDALAAAVVALPRQLGVYLRSLGYGSFLNVYVCTNRIQVGPGGPTVPLGPGTGFSERCR